MLTQQQIKSLESMTFLDKYKIRKLSNKTPNFNDIQSAINQAVEHYHDRLQ